MRLIIAAAVVLAGCAGKARTVVVCPEPPPITHQQALQLDVELGRWEREFENLRIEVNLELPDSQISEAVLKFFELRRELGACNAG